MASRGHQHRPQLLVVEDEPRLARAFASALAADGASVDIALTVDAALVKIGRAPRVDAILLDLAMPDGPGERVLDAIEAESGPPRVLVITGIEDPPRLVALLLRGYHVLPKPMTAAALREAARWLVAMADPIAVLAVRHGLSTRETEVLRLGVNGLCSKEVAEQLACAVNTVWVYWQRIEAKCGCDSQRAVLAEVYRYATRSPPGRVKPCSVDGKGPL